MPDDDRFGPRGQRLFDQLTKGITDEVTLVLAEESARLADRLDELDSIIQGKGVLRLMQFRVLNHYFDEDGDGRVSVTVKFDSVLSEARQQASALRQLLGSFDGAKAAPATEPKGSPLDELQKRRDGRQPTPNVRTRPAG